MRTKSLLCFIVSVLMMITRTESQMSLFPSEENNRCNIDCSQEKPRAICGTDGRTYGSKCEIEKAKCEGHPVEFKSRGSCPETGRCWAQRALAQAQAKKYVLGIFIPECKEDGSYSEFQCHMSTGYCWCVDDMGKPIPGSSVRYSKPNCSQPEKRSNRRRSSRGRKEKKGCSNTDRSAFNANMIDIFRLEYVRLPHHYTSAPDSMIDPLLDTEEKRVIQWKFDQLDTNRDNFLKKKEVRDLRRMAKKIVKPKSCAKVFTKLCDLDQDKKISRKEWSVCLGVDINNEQVDPADEAMHDTPDEDLPSSPVDHLGVRPGHLGAQLPRLKYDGDTGIPTSDSKEDESQDCISARRNAIDNHKQDPAAGIFIPDCSPVGLYERAQCHKSTEYCWCVSPVTGKPIRGTATHRIRPECDSARKAARSFKGCSIQKKHEFLDELVQTFVDQMVDENRNSTSGDLPSHEKAAKWKFAKMDSNSNQVLDKREWKGFRREWRKFHQENKHRKRLRKCWRNLPRYCDGNGNQKITVEEWLVCTGIHRESRGTLPLVHKRRGPNPFSTILKSD